MEKEKIKNNSKTKFDVKSPSFSAPSLRESAVALKEATVYNQEGKEVGFVKLPKNVFSTSWNPDLVHQVVVSMMSDARTIYAHTKDRSEVSGGGKKPWKQKGLGRARHGSTRSPIWVHGGVAHGPNGLKNYERKINKKMKTKALFAILSKKMIDGEIIFIDKFSIDKPKTIEAIKILESISKVAKDIYSKKKNSAIIAISGKKQSFEKSFSNIGNVLVQELRNINPLMILNNKYLVIENPEESIAFIGGKMGNNK